jgi:hypothetical protein
MKKPLQFAARGLASALACAALLTACGGGGDSGTVTITAKDGELIVIDAGSSTLPAKTYTLNTTYGASYATYDDWSSLRLVSIEPENEDFDTSVTFVQGTPSKFMVFFNAQVAGAAMGTYKVFACRSDAWTADDLSGTTAFSMPVCSTRITIDETNRRAVYTNLSLPAEEGGGKAMVISATFSWPVPIPGSLLGGSGSGSGSASPAPATSATPSISTSPPPVAPPVEPAAASVG